MDYRNVISQLLTEAQFQESAAAEKEKTLAAETDRLTTHITSHRARAEECRAAADALRHAGNVAAMAYRPDTGQQGDALRDKVAARQRDA